MQKDPQDRYEDMEALISDLQSIRSGAAPQIEVEEKSVPSIAVLPFADMSPQKDQEYFCDGISESIINELTQIEDLRVIARTSAFSFKGQNLDVREIGKKLNVGTVLEGSIQKAGDRIRVTAQLVNTSRGEHIWSEKYDRDMEDIFAIQDEISGSIVAKLKPRLLPEEKDKPSKHEGVNLKAYDLYLKGLFFSKKLTEEGLHKAIEYFDQAIQEEPNYALAYAGLANSYHSLVTHRAYDPNEATIKAKEAALKALAIDDNLPEAHASLGFIKTTYDWDWEGAEKEFRKAIDLNPGCISAHQYFSVHLLWRGRFDEALLEIRQAQRLDPLSLSINRSLGTILVYAGQLDDAEDVLRKTVEMDSGFPLLHQQLGILYFERQMYEEAMVEFRKEREINDAPGTDAWIGKTYARMQEKDKAIELLNDLLERSKTAYVQPAFLAFMYVALGEKDKAFELFDEAYRKRGFSLCWLKIHLALDSIRSDPRYKALLVKMGLAKPDATVPMIEPSPSIAVMPFVNMSADPEQEYFCDGLSEDLINALTQIADLRVIARTSAFSFKGKNVKMQEIGKELNVATVLEGSVRKAGNRLRITAQLVETAAGHHLWSEQYNREMDDVFAIQDEITHAIVGKLKPTLLAGEEKKLAKRQTVDLEPYNLYLKGRYFFNKVTEEGFKKATEYFERAIKMDPDYALAYAGLADSYISIPINTPLSSKAFFEKGKELALKALEIDEELGEAHASLGYINTAFDWDWKGAEKEFKRAIELNPGYALAHHWYALYLGVMERFEESIREAYIALELDPLSLVMNRIVGMVLAMAGESDRAIEMLKKTVEMDPLFSNVHLALGFVYSQESLYEKALVEYEKEIEASDGWDPVAQCAMGITYAQMGKKDKARKVLDSLTNQLEEENLPHSSLADLHFALGENDKGFKCLDRAYQKRDPWLSFINARPSSGLLHSSRTDPRFIALLRKMNLEP
jgi:TolB-like protein/Tfp pilus assembly protein PilF